MSNTLIQENRVCKYCRGTNFKPHRQGDFCQKACRISFSKNGNKPKDFKTAKSISYFGPAFDYEGNSI